MRKNIISILAFFIFGMAGGIFADQILWPYLIERPLLYKYKLEPNPIYVTEKKEIVVQENTALKDAIEKVEKTVVGIRTRLQNGVVLEGSGLVVSSDGLLVSFANLIPQGAETSIFLGEKQFPFQVLKRDLKENLALIKIEESGLSTAGFANADKIRLGERIFLLGIIFNKEVSPRKNVNEGIIKNFGDDTIQTSITDNKNVAGSPIFDIEGNIIGLSIVDKEGNVSVLPVSKVKKFIGF